jgi:hypothetical protein
MTVAERRLRDKLVKRRPSMAVSNNTIKHNLMQVRCLKLQHLMDTSTADLISNLLDLRSSIIRSSKACVDKLLTVLLKKIISILVSTSRDLDQLCETVADLCYRETAEESEVKKCVGWGVVGAETVLVAAVVDGDFDGD